MNARRGEARRDRSQLDNIGVADVFENVYLSAHALHVLHILRPKIGLEYTNVMLEARRKTERARPYLHERIVDDLDGDYISIGGVNSFLDFAEGAFT